MPNPHDTLSIFAEVAISLAGSSGALTPLEPTTLSSAGSAMVFLLVTPWLILDWRKISKLEEEERSEVKAYVIYPFNLLAAAVLMLQIANVFVFGKSWPFFLALVVGITFAFQQFILLVKMRYRDT